MKRVKIFKKRNLAFGLAIGASSVIGCTKKVIRLTSDSVVDISGRWNDTDSRVVAKYISDKLLAGAWLREFQMYRVGPEQSMDRRKNKPVVIVGDIKNKTSEHIEADTFIKDIEHEMINSGTIRVIANSILREKIRTERRSQIGNTLEEERKKFGKELGADFMMFGTINMIVDANEDDTLNYYQVSLELVDLETGEVVWSDNKKIKKYRSTSRSVRSHQKNTIPAN